MKDVNARLIICGKGNFFNQTQRLIWEHQLESRIELRGLVSPDELKQLTPTAYIGITLFEATGLNQYHSLANRFFDYMMAGIPQVCVNYPEYAAINQKYQIASLLNNTEPAAIAAALNNLLVDDVLYKELTANCLSAREILNWEEEKKALLNFYTHL
jgi:glycosyltransferase involved in cell wall biosynthesis